jgi:uncharacterized protein YjbI with pentapeptide repeats/antitoxin component of RelBE/YafQ-DinJ toxin-antitoxin module
MKVHKPGQLSLLFKTVVTPRWPVVFVSALAGFRFGGRGLDGLIQEGEMWPLAMARLNEDEPLDLGFPKPSAEFLVYGECCAPQPVQGMRVRASVAGKTKSLRVHGDRRWVRGAPSEPKPFTSMNLGWENAYGGPGYERNPKGKGFAAAPDGSRPLPNILPEGVTMTSPDQKAQEAGFGGVPFFWPQRIQYMGKYDAAWLRERWPYYPGESSLKFMYAAQEDQRFAGFLRGDEPCVVENMHPAKPRQEFHLPGVRARAFLQLTVRGRAEFRELAMHLDTVWLFPAEETGIVLFRGVCPVADEELDDVAHCVAGLESLDQTPEPVSFYEAMLAPLEEPGMVAPPPPAPQAESPSAPPPEPWPSAETPEVRELERVSQEIQQHADKILVEHGLTMDDVERKLAEASGKKKPQTFDDLMGAMDGRFSPEPSLEELVKRLESQVAEIEAEAKKALAARGMTLEDAEKLIAEKQASFKPEDLASVVDRIKANPELPAKDKAEILANLATLQESLAGLETLAPAGPGPAAEASEPESEPEPKPSPSGRIGPKDGAEAADMHARGESLAGFDLRGFDFSNRDLSGADFSSANLDGADFFSAKLAKANFTNAGLLEAKFAKADCKGALFREARMIKADFAKADLSGADVSSADLTRAQLPAAKLEAARLDKAVFERADLAGASLKGAGGREADFFNADLSAANFSGADFPGVDFSQAILSKARLSKLRAPGARFGGAACAECDLREAALPGVRADQGTSLSGADLSGADLSGARMERADLSGAKLFKALLDGADLARTNCAGTKFAGASLKNATLHKANLQGADLSRANLFKASLRMADASRASFRASNLYGVDLYKSKLSGADMEGANLKRTLLRLEGLHES